MIASLNTRVAGLVSAKYRIAKVMNYHEDDFLKIIRKIKSYQDEFDIQPMDNVTHLPFGGGRKFTMVGIKPTEGNDDSVWQRSDLAPGQQVNLAKLFNCEAVPEDEDSIQSSPNPFIKHCPVQGCNTCPAAAIVFDRVHNSAQAEDVAFELLNQLKRACKSDDKDFGKIAEAGDQWLDIRYSRNSGYVLHVLVEHFSALMLALTRVNVSEIKIDDKFGKFNKMSISAAKTHYLKMMKAGSGEEAKGVMFGLPSNTTEKEVGDAVLKLYDNIASMSASDLDDLDLPCDMAAVSAADFEIQIRDGMYSSGDHYRMAFVTCPDVKIFVQTIHLGRCATLKAVAFINKQLRLDSSLCSLN